MAGGADVILIPEIPYRADAIVDKLKTRAGKKHITTTGHLGLREKAVVSWS